MKILVTIASWGTKNDEHLLRLVAEYRSMSFDADIVVLSNIQRDVAPGVEVVVAHRRSLWSFHRLMAAAGYPWLLREEYREWKRNLDFPFAHKQILADRVNDYDLFIFSEDDTLITERNLRAFQAVSAVIREDEIPGFLRYEEYPDGGRNYPEVHGHFHWDPASVRSRGGYTLASFTNEHSACYVLTRHQLQRAVDSGGYLVAPHAEKYDLLCTAATDPYTQCGFEKLICISHLENFLIHHLPNKYVGTHFGVDDRELRRQIDVLLRIGKNGQRVTSLFSTETKLECGIYSKNYYEPIRSALVSAIPRSARTVLSVGCGWGATEAWLAERGLQVTAIPLDPVIPGGAEAKGVEIVTGNFAEARKELTGRQFDCLLFSDILHLVPNPVEILSNFSTLLSPEGVSVVGVPNTTPLGPRGRAIRNQARIGQIEGYQKAGIHFSSHKTIRAWFRDAGMHVKSFRNILGPRALRYRRFAIGLADPWLASEFVVVASEASHPSAE